MAKAPIVFFGHHKAGTVYIQSVWQYLCSLYGMRYGHAHSRKMMGNSLSGAIKNGGFEVFSYTNAHYDAIDLDDVRGIHVIRDPRDMMVSAYFSHKHSHSFHMWPELEAHRKELEALDKDAGLLASMEFTHRLPIDGEDCLPIQGMADWNYEDERILEVKFEDLISRPDEWWLKMAAHTNMLDDRELGLPTILNQIVQLFGSRTHLSKATTFPRWAWLQAVNSQSFERKAGGRNPGTEKVTSHFRKGEPGDWKNHFTDQHKQWFKEKYPGLLQKLGYENSAIDW